jgi:phospholipid/cholesterol/gamma-HCH transport system ATP-binding protein
VAASALELDHVSIAFQRTPLLRDVNLTVSPGESIVVIGPSGVGKSVLLKLFAGILAPTEGRVLVEGNDLRAIDEQAKTRLMLKMGMLFQRNALFDSLRCGENIAFPLRETTSLSEDAIQKRVTDFLAAVGLSEARELYPNEISGGMQKRLGIARALALEPGIVFYDDPTAGLDPITSRKIIELILGLKKQNRSTVVAVVNDMARAFQLADRLVMLVDHELIVTGDKKQTLNHPDPRVQQFVHAKLEGPLTADA